MRLKLSSVIQIRPTDFIVACVKYLQAVTTNEGGFVKDVDPTVLLATQVACGLTWVCWIFGAIATATKKPPQP